MCFFPNWQQASVREPVRYNIAEFFRKYPPPPPQMPNKLRKWESPQRWPEEIIKGLKMEFWHQKRYGPKTANKWAKKG